MELLIFGSIAFILWYLISKKSEIKSLKETNSNLINSNEIIDKKFRKLESEKLKLEREYNSLKQSEDDWKNKSNKLEILITENKIKESLSRYSINSEMLKFYNEYYDSKFDELKNYFRYKKNPSLKSSETINEVQKDFTSLKIENRQLKLLISQFITEEDHDVSETSNVYEEFDYENSYKYDNRFSKDEWAKLPPIKKLDIILERYIDKKKSKLEIGLEFERYCGYLYEKNGYKVKYNGILNGLSDGGIDLIAENEIKKIYIQCKYWGNNKVIRENSISQLFGSSLSRAISEGETTESFFKKVKEEKIRMVVLTKTELSGEAKEFCKKLNILFKENMKMKNNYPRVKLVEGKEKIFYIPTDQKYDTICCSSPYKNYSRTLTCEKAAEEGYRHSYRWSGKRN